ncbi:BLUF domain-containing protein [Acinetobacter bereziniae]|uniref:BLUF domain-containing protein n=1 Tax=Acinetobacter bereziniae TaxID=106648 RepID=UPI00225057AD|nr:BLUF domain-containing protein [Acinetobacter bereziniae]
MEFVRVLYASKATRAHPELKSDLIEILNTAVDFNSRNEITGVLYYGHGYFVQCLEGRKSKVNDLFYNYILKDHRHHNCKILYQEKCDIGLFKHWNMKFAPVNKRLVDFFQHHYLDDFNPFLLSNETIPLFINLLAGEYANEPYNFEIDE